MARYTEAKCRLCRREGCKLFLKGDRCFSEKCAVDSHRRPYAPGQHGRARKKASEYAVQLREKQKVRRSYGILERQFHSYFEKAEKQKGVTGTNLLVILERRLDNVVYRLGFATSRNQARQLVRHGIFTLNGRKVNIPSLQVKVGDSIEVPEKHRKIPVLEGMQDAIGRRGCPAWLESDGTAFKGTVKALPQRDDIQFDVKEQLIVELYSK
ncbi:MAG: 30S ribosomal protein S4 [Desulfovibrio sp.]|nr:30S ribosomal protein S4 [Desulfovibrio sp.]